MMQISTWEWSLDDWIGQTWPGWSDWLCSCYETSPFDFRKQSKWLSSRVMGQNHIHNHKHDHNHDCKLRPMQWYNPPYPHTPVSSSKNKRTLKTPYNTLYHLINIEIFAAFETQNNSISRFYVNLPQIWIRPEVKVRSVLMSKILQRRRMMKGASLVTLLITKSVNWWTYTRDPGARFSPCVWPRGLLLS